MPRNDHQRARHKRQERARRHRRQREAAEARRAARVGVWFPKLEDQAEQPRPATLDDEILEMQRALLLDEDL